MKQDKWFKLYPNSSAASNLSIAGGAVKLLSILFLIAAVLTTLALAMSGVRLTLAAGLGTALIFLMDELDDMVFTAFQLWGLVVACRYVACVLQGKADLLGHSTPVPQAQPAPQPEQDVTT